MKISNSLLDSLRSATVYDLGQPYFIGMPHHPVHPPFLFSLTKMHGDYVLANGGSSASLRSQSVEPAFQVISYSRPVFFAIANFFLSMGRLAASIISSLYTTAPRPESASAFA